MVEFVLRSELGNEAMSNGVDIGNALKDVAKRLWGYGDEDKMKGCYGTIMDLNGNSVGKWQVK